ncbi:uncharacterized protein EI90DRAFT_3062531 [Cantharellus anzutake]|uniref:uncharacterized protein n=1 Tax=Cantharellus anzutake TaxID=1750568 RepID=UPI0019035D4B|nr:uncharacterized protein EI90DRAFT_3062531 [Cantharellus anzutake]KAF8329414.1 hypothetical protein EI90DRAFT_3062531 [Cantharellus anzutake]
MQGIPQGPKNWNGRPLPPKEPPVVPGAPSGPRGDRPVVPPGVKDASHPAFASQTRLPPSGPSRRGPPTSQPEAGEGNKAVPTGPRVRTTSAVSAVSSETERVASKQTPTLTGPPHHVPEVSAANLVRRAQIERERDEAIAQRDQEQTSRRNKRVASASPPPAKSRKISPSPNRQRFQSPSPAVPKRITGSNNVPVAKVRTFGKLDQAGNDNNTASRDITRDRDYHRMDVSDDYTASRPSFDLRNETGLPAAFPLLQHERNSSLYQPPANALSHSFNRPLNDHQANENQYRSRSIPTPTPVQIERERLPERRWGAQLRSNRDQSSGLPNNSYPGYDLRKPETTNRQDPAPPVSSAPWPSRSRGQTNGDFGLDLGEGSQRRPRDFQGPEISRAQAPELRDLVESRTTYSSILPPGYYIKNPDTYEVGLRLVSRRRSEEVILGSPRGESNRTGSLLDRIVRQGPPVIHSENGPVPLRDRITASGEVSPRAGEMDDSVRSDSGDEVNGTSGGGQGPNSGSGGRKRRKSRRKSARR